MRYEIWFCTALHDRRMRDFIISLNSIFGDFWKYEFTCEELPESMRKVVVRQARSFLKNWRGMMYDLRAIHDN